MFVSVSDRASERRNFSSEFSDKSSDISDAMRLVRMAAEPRHVGDSVKSAVQRASRALGFTPTRTRDLWYGQARRIEASEMDALRAVERKQVASSLQEDRRRYVEQVAALRARLQMRDPEFHRADCMALEWLLNEIVKRE